MRTWSTPGTALQKDMKSSTSPDCAPCAPSAPPPASSSRLVLHARETHEIVAHLFESRAFAVVLVGFLGGAVEAQRDVFQRRFQQFARHGFIQERSVGGEQRRDVVALAIFDAVEDLAIHERLAQADQHHVLGGAAGIAHQPLEDLVRHVLFGLLVGFARTHGAIEIALRGGLDDVLHGQRVEARAAGEIAAQKLPSIPDSCITGRRALALIVAFACAQHPRGMQDRVRKLNDAPVRTDARYVLYWSQMNRRVGEPGVGARRSTCERAGLPVLFYEGLTCTYPHANDRLHTFHARRRAGYGGAVRGARDRLCVLSAAAQERRQRCAVPAGGACRAGRHGRLPGVRRGAGTTRACRRRSAWLTWRWIPVALCR